MKHVKSNSKSKRSSLQAFNEFDAMNPRVWKLFVQYTFDVINAGYKNYSTEGIVNRIRWHVNIETRGDEFKLNNNYQPFYARKFHKKFPQYDGFFRTRKSVADRITEQTKLF